MYRVQCFFEYTTFRVYECVGIYAGACDPACMKYTSGEINYIISISIEHYVFVTVFVTAKHTFVVVEFS